MRRPTRSPFHRPAIQTLERLHSELGGQILENKTEALRLAESMRHVEAVIKMLDPTFNLRRIAIRERQCLRSVTICLRARPDTAGVMPTKNPAWRQIRRVSCRRRTAANGTAQAYPRIP
jgi:hypothetical protein